MDIQRMFLQFTQRGWAFSKKYMSLYTSTFCCNDQPELSLNATRD